MALLDVEKVLNQGRIPIIINKYYDDDPPLICNKFQVPEFYTIRQLYVSLAKYVPVENKYSFMLMTKTKMLLNTHSFISLIYNKYKSSNGILYLYYIKENVFGSMED